MQFHRATIAALAATMFLTFFAAEGSGANAEISETRPAQPASLTDETVPQALPSATATQTTQFVAQALVQPIPITGSKTDAERTLDDATPGKAASLAALVAQMPPAGRMSAELECLAGAIYFEARGEPLTGQLAVGEVIVNRAASGRFPSSYCGVVYQPQQFSFVRGRSMPAINRGSAAWKRAAAIARVAHENLWDSKAEKALFFHARSVNPGWSRSKVALATIDSHVFYR